MSHLFLSAAASTGTQSRSESERLQPTACQPESEDEVGQMRLSHEPGPFVLYEIPRVGVHRRRILRDTQDLLAYIAKKPADQLPEIAGGYEDALDEDVMRIPLSSGGYALIDAEDYQLVRGYTWNANANGYASTTETIHDGSVYRILMHRLVLLMGVEDERKLDHKNGDPSDNRKVNLRVCNSMQNSWNSKKPKSNTSGVKGVGLVGGKYWRGTIKANGEVHSKGFGTDKEAAIRWVREMREQLHGEFARHE
jgi:hypothetical protein